MLAESRPLTGKGYPGGGRCRFRGCGMLARATVHVALGFAVGRRVRTPKSGGLMQQPAVAVTIDFGLIVAALAPTIALIATALISRRTLKVAQSTHALVNDAMTTEKRERLAVLKANRMLLEATRAPQEVQMDVEFLSYLANEIAMLEQEIQQRNHMAAAVLPSKKE